MRNDGRIWLVLALLLSFVATSSVVFAQDAPPAEGADGVDVQPPAEPDPRHRVGHYEIDLPGIPYRVIHETRLRYGWEPGSTATEKYQRTPDTPTNDGNRTSTDWFVEVPETYRADRPAGLVIMIRTGAARRCPEPWREALTTHNLVWVGFPAGYASRPWFAHARALVAVRLMAERYALDPRRVYLVGQDNGARVANAAVVLTPETFRAAFMINESAFPADLEMGDATIDGIAPNADRRLLRNAARQATLVYFNGGRDIERELMLTPAAAYDRAGFNVTVIDQPEHGTQAVPGPEHLATAIHAFESPFHRDAERDYERATRLADRGKRGEALPMLLDALSVGSTAEFAEDARAKVTELQDAYAAEVAAVEAHLAAGELGEAAAALNAFNRDWGDHGEADAERLTDALREARRAARE